MIGEQRSGSWGELLGPRNLGASSVLAGGVALDAITEFLTTSLLPSTVADIGGRTLYAWVITVYLVGSVVGAGSVGPMLWRLGPRRSYLLAAGGFVVGSLGCSAAPTMELLLLARTLQGFAGGVLAGLAYALISTTLPRRLWTRASALISGMWALGTLVGPAVGGVAGQYGLWRWAFGAMAASALVLAVLVPSVLPPRVRTIDTDERAPAVPWRSLALLGLAALVVSIASIQQTVGATSLFLLVGAVAIGAFLMVDRRAPTQVLPPSVFGPGPVKWIILALGLLMATTLVDVYTPLFGQELAHLTPLAAGLLGATPAIGWSVSEIVSASIRDDRTIVNAVRFAPLITVAGLLVSALSVREDMPTAFVVVWAASLLVAGTGVGVAWPHLSAWAMGRVNDPAEGPTAAAAINTVQLVTAAFGAGIAGTVVNTGGLAGAMPARWQFIIFAGVAALGAIVTTKTTPHHRDRRRDDQDQRDCQAESAARSR